MYTRDQIIEKFRKIHGDKYGYDNFIYTRLIDPSYITCPEHGNFLQSAHSHLKGQGCPKCGLLRRAKKHNSNTEEFIKKAQKIHGDSIDYSKVEYINNKTPACFICPEHGEFWMKPNYILNGRGCPKCGNSRKGNFKKLTLDEFVNRSQIIHNNKYDYSHIKEYNNNRSKLPIICPEHGLFMQSPDMHLSGQGCPECAKEKSAISRRYTRDEYIKEAKKVHDNKYSYDKLIYNGINEFVTITCPIHGDYEQKASYHLSGNGCPKCGIVMSNGENEIFEFIEKLVGKGNVLSRNKSIIKPYEIDIYIPSMKIAFEYDGVIWHSEKFGKDRQYHLNKTKMCNDIGIKLYHIFEDEYIYHKDIVLSKIKHILGFDSDKKSVYARKCTILSINKETARDFLNKWHIQGYTNATLSYGAYYNNVLLAVMSFRKLKNNEDGWELVRFTVSGEYNCIGVGGKLFSTFIKNENPNYVKSFADRRWTQNKNNLYTNIGFTLEGIVPPDYRYVLNGIERIHKFNFRKNILHKKYNLPISMTENEMAREIGAYKIWDCGLLRYVWKKVISGN